MAKLERIPYASQWSVKTEELIKNSTFEELKSFILQNGEVEEDPDEIGRIHDRKNKVTIYGKTYLMSKEFGCDEFFISDDGRIFFLLSLVDRIEIFDDPKEELRSRNTVIRSAKWEGFSLESEDHEAHTLTFKKYTSEVTGYEFKTVEYDPEALDTYSIYEGHMDSFRKKINRIKNKCAKMGCEFFYEEFGEEFKEIPTGDLDPVTRKPIKVTCKFILVHAEGTAIINDWEFVASVEHTEKGNIFSKAMTNVEIPMRYRHTGSCICEHCNTNRARKDTFIIRNVKTGEFKQVGKSCLKDFTHGMSASNASYFASLKDVFEEEETRPVSGFKWGQKHYSTEEILHYTAETIRHFGYTKTDNRGSSTRDKMDTFFRFLHGDTRYWEPEYLQDVRNQIEKVGFNPESPEAIQMTKEALDWLEGQESSSDYMHNLKTACACRYSNSGRFGILVSLFPTWNRDLEIQAKRKAETEAGKNSIHVGQIGDRIMVDVESIKCLTSWETSFNGWSTETVYLWKITGKDGNIYTWKSQKYLNEENPPKTIKGTVKAHNEFREVKQTELTRCRIN